MKTIELGKNGTMFHHVDVSEQRAEGNHLIGLATVTGHYKGKLEIGDKLDFQFRGQEHHEVIEVVEQRDHKGVFNNHIDAKDSFFKVKTTFKNLMRR